MNRYVFTEPCGCVMYADAADVAHALAALVARLKHAPEEYNPRNRPYFQGKLSNTSGEYLGDVIFRPHDGGAAWRPGYSLWWRDLVQEADTVRHWEIILPNRRLRKAITRAMGGRHPEAHDCSTCVAAGYVLAVIPNFPPEAMARSAAATAQIIDMVSLGMVLERELAGVCHVCGGPVGPLGSLCEEHLDWLVGESHAPHL